MKALTPAQCSCASPSENRPNCPDTRTASVWYVLPLDAANGREIAFWLSYERVGKVDSGVGANSYRVRRGHIAGGRRPPGRTFRPRRSVQRGAAPGRLSHGWHAEARFSRIDHQRALAEILQPGSRAAPWLLVFRGRTLVPPG